MGYGLWSHIFYPLWLPLEDRVLCRCIDSRSLEVTKKRDPGWETHDMGLSALPYLSVPLRVFKTKKNDSM